MELKTSVAVDIYRRDEFSRTLSRFPILGERDLYFRYLTSSRVRSKFDRPKRRVNTNKSEVCAVQPLSRLAQRDMQYQAVEADTVPLHL